jgi:hypothetical protein
MSSTPNYSLDRRTLSKLVSHRYFFFGTALLLLIVTVVAIGSGAALNMETPIRSRLEWSNKSMSRGDLSRGVSEEIVWWLRDLANPVYGSSNDMDRVYLRLDGGGVQSVVIKTSNGTEKRNNTIAFTLMEIDMLSILLAEKYTNDSAMLTGRAIYNGRRKVLMKLLTDNDRVRFTLVKYTPKTVHGKYATRLC